MQANTALLQKLPQTAEEIQAAATYLEAAPIAENHWQVIKGVYKQLEENPNAELLTILINKLDQARFSGLKGKYPSKATLGYMKRRVNRFLRNTAKDNPELYFQICSQIIGGQNHSIDPVNQWILMKILLGNSKRFEQKRHGRGAFVALENTSNFARSENSVPQIWAQHLDFIGGLLKKSDAPIDVYEFAVKTLSANQAEMPILEEKTLKNFFKTNSIWLNVIAAQESYLQYKNGLTKDAQLLANTFFHASANVRKQLFTDLQALIGGKTPIEKSTERGTWFSSFVNAILGSDNQNSKNKKYSDSWYQTFTSNISHLYFSNSKKSFSKRRLKDALEMTLLFKQHLSFTIVNKHIGAIFQNDDSRLHEIAIATAEQVKGNEMTNWLKAVPKEKTEIRDRLQEVFIRKIDVSTLTWQQLEGFVYSEEFAVADFGWRLVSKWNQQKRFTERFWGRSYYRAHNNPSLLHCIQSESGVDLLLKHCKQKLRWVIWYKQTFIYIYQNALQKLKEVFKPLFYENARGHNFLAWLPFISQLEEERNQIVLNLRNGVDQNHLSSANFIRLMIGENEWIKNVVWDLFMEKCLNKSKMNELITLSLQRIEIDTSKKFIDLMVNSKEKKVRNLFFEVLPEIIEGKPELVKRLIPVFDYVVDLLNENNTFDLIKNLNEKDWNTIRHHLVKFVEEHPSMWLKFMDAIHQETTITLQNRTIGEEEILELFYQTSNVDVLDYHQPIYADILYEWIQRHTDLFGQDSDALFKGVIHKDPKIRKWSFEQTDKVGITIPFALRMMEAGMPETFHKGKAYFEAVPSNDPEEVEYVLALCDSPQLVVRKYGLKYFEARKENLKKNDIAIASLSEHSDVFIQEFVAQALEERKNTNEKFVKDFDKGVLRTRNRGRKTKELVKSRLQTAQTSNLDIKTLMELARSRNTKDREWAIEQLTKMALAGEEVEGFVLG